MKLAAPVLALVAASCAPFETEAEEAARLYQEARRLLSKSADPGKALPLLDEAIELHPVRPEYFTARARVRREIGRGPEAHADYTAAIGLLREAGAPAGELVPVLAARAALRAEQGRLADAEVDFGQALALAPDSAWLHLERALVRRREGRTKEADDDAARARQLAPGGADAFYNEGVAAHNLGRPDDAERLYLLALEGDPGHWKAHLALGRLHLEARRFERAAAALGRAAALRPADADLHYHHGNALLADSKYAEALAAFTRAVDLDPRPEILAARGIVRHRHLKDPEGAEADFTRTIELDPLSYTAYFNRGLLRHEMIRYREAESDLRRALAIQGTPEGIRALARLLHDRGDHEKAMDAFQRALGMARDEALRKALEEEWTKARDAWVEQAVKEKPKEPRQEERK
jgi:tetratricopeptide (TPR) repeat protein